MDRCLPKNKIFIYLKKLSNEFDVFFPIEKNNHIFLTSNPIEIPNLSFKLPDISPKKLFLPFIQELFSYENSQITKKAQSIKQKILFGVHPKDLKAINLLHKIFKKDHYWNHNRKNLYIISIGPYSYNEDFDCDIYLESNTDVFEVYLKNKQAKKLLDYKNLFKNSPFNRENKIKENDPIFSDTDKLSNVLIKTKDSKIWDDLEKICLGCGICSYVCPMCYCHHQEDIICHNKIKRNRVCDSCLNENFQKISSVNFSPNLKDRLYQWYYHKFVTLPKEIGHVGCVDCGRCIRNCPAKINFKAVLQSLIDEYDKQS